MSSLSGSQNDQGKEGDQDVETHVGLVGWLDCCSAQWENSEGVIPFSPQPSLYILDEVFPIFPLKEIPRKTAASASGNDVTAKLKQMSGEKFLGKKPERQQSVFKARGLEKSQVFTVDSLIEFSRTAVLLLFVVSVCFCFNYWLRIKVWLQVDNT